MRWEELISPLDDTQAAPVVLVPIPVVEDSTPSFEEINQHVEGPATPVKAAKTVEEQVVELAEKDMAERIGKRPRQDQITKPAPVAEGLRRSPRLIESAMKGKKFICCSICSYSNWNCSRCI